MTIQRTRYRTQWATQFFAAAELTRRGYLVSLTFGNAQVADLLVQSPNGNHFTVDVKGQSSKGFWLIQQRRPSLPDHYFILVYLPKNGEPPKYYILRSEELMKKREEYKQYVLPKGRYRDHLGGINWTTAFQYENNWGALPL